MDEDARGIVVHHLHVRHERGARVQALEEVVRQEGVLGHAPLEGGHERVHVVEALAREDPLSEQVLVGVRHRGRVGVDSGVAGIEAGEERAGGAGHGHADSGLEDPVPLDDAAETDVEARAVQGVSADPDQLLGGVPGQARVGIEGEAVAHAAEDLDVADLHGEARVRGPAQDGVELLELSPLALPPHPDVLARVPLPHAVEQVEPVRASLAEAGVQGLDAGPRRFQDRLVLRHLLRGGVDEVAQDREVDAGVEIAESQDLDVLDEGGHRGHARQQRGHDHHGPRVLGNSGGELQAGEPPRRRPTRGQALDEGDRHLAGRQQ